MIHLVRTVIFIVCTLLMLNACSIVQQKVVTEQEQNSCQTVESKGFKEKTQKAIDEKNYVEIEKQLGLLYTCLEASLKKVNCNLDDNTASECKATRSALALLARSRATTAYKLLKYDQVKTFLREAMFYDPENSKEYQKILNRLQ